MQRLQNNRIITVLTMFFVVFTLTSCGKNASEEAYSKPNITQEAENPNEKEEETEMDAFVPSAVKDIAEIKKIRSWLEYFYYNNIFDENVDNETGEISEDAKISFAVSHIMQLEHKGLKFDADTFRLYIPKKMLEEVVMRFFGYKVENHHSISKSGILFEEDNYIIQANVREWPTRLDIVLVVENAPQQYSALLNGNNTEAGEVEHQINVEFEKKDGRYLLKKYQMITDKELFVSGNPLDVGTSGDEPGIESSGSFGNTEESGDEESNEQNPENSQTEDELNKDAANKENTNKKDSTGDSGSILEEKKQEEKKEN